MGRYILGTSQWDAIFRSHIADCCSGGTCESEPLSRVGTAISSSSSYTARCHLLPTLMTRALKTGFVVSEKSELEEQGERVRSVIKRIVDEANAIMSRRLGMVTRHMNCKLN